VCLCGTAPCFCFVGHLCIFFCLQILLLEKLEQDPTVHCSSNRSESSGYKQRHANNNLLDEIVELISAQHVDGDAVGSGNEHEQETSTLLADVVELFTTYHALVGQQSHRIDVACHDVSHMFRLILLYHDPELCHFIDSLPNENALLSVCSWVTIDSCWWMCVYVPVVCIYIYIYICVCVCVCVCVSV